MKAFFRVRAIWRAVEWCREQGVAPLHVVARDVPQDAERYEAEARIHDGPDEHDAGASLNELRRM